MNMSTIRCWSTWNDPIAVPNCFRVLEYSSVAEFSSPMAPTASAQSAPIARSRQASSAARILALPRGPGRNDQIIRPGSRDDGRLLAGQDVILAIAPRRGPDVSEVEARARFGPG